ncbi:MAG TPA: hypothetical protein VFF62_04880 [Candidatus Nitrosocosmicus sp.]|nr:hypothetical protein [Candidatus Nitrosocosmicus sp.]
MISRRAMMAVGLAALATAGLAAAGPASADEPPAVAAPAPAGPPAVSPRPGSAPNVFQLLNRSAETPPDTTLRESLRPDLTPPPSGRGFEKMPDGSLRYGNLRVRGKVGAECPDDPFHEAPPLPRRGRY